MADKLSKQHACQLWLDQEADKAIAAKEIYSVASKRITGEVNTHFEAAYKARSIERRIRRRAEKANPKPKTIEKSTVGQVSHIPEKSTVVTTVTNNPPVKSGKEFHPKCFGTGLGYRCVCCSDSGECRDKIYSKSPNPMTVEPKITIDFNSLENLVRTYLVCYKI